MAIDPIVSVEWLEANLDSVVICDVRAAAEYSAGHIPGAVSAVLNEITASEPAPFLGRHPLPTAEDFAKTLGALGIDITDTVVAYDGQGGLMAGRLVWMLRMIGSDAALLDGGLPVWKRELSEGEAEGRTAVERQPVAWPADALVQADDVVAAIASGTPVIDARSAERFRGDAEHLDPRAGHIPGAINIPCASNLTADGTIANLDELRERYVEAGVTEDSIFYCGSGVTACHDLLVAEAVGLGKAKLFVGSWSGWSSDQQRPAGFGAGEDVSFVEVFTRYGTQQADKIAVTLGHEKLTYGQLHQRSTDLAHHLRSMGVVPGQFVTIAEPNSFEYFIAFVACWKLGAVPQPVSSRLPRLELDAIVELAESPVVIGIEHQTRPFLPKGFVAPATPEGADLGSVPVSPAWKAPTSGGSTGRPKLIVSGDPAVFTASMNGLANIIGSSPHGTMVMPGPLYHNGPLIWSWNTLLKGGHLVQLQRFDAEATLAAIAEHSATAIYLVPTMMQRIWKLEDGVKFAYDLSSLKTAFHLAEPCPKWLKEAWIDWLGPDVLWELYGGTEGQCFTVLDGNQWLTHPGSVGAPVSGELKITDDDGNELACGETGSVWMRNTTRETPSYRYVGAEPEERDGWECLGNMGWLDAEGFLYLADRRKDMILVGGSNVFPAEIEAAIGAHPKVRSSAVIGLPDEEKGSRIHAIVDSVDLTEAELMPFLAERLVSYKLPWTFEFVSEPLRDDAGKVRRGALAAERS